jgi:hypothetical protein
MPRQHPWERPPTPEEQRQRARAAIVLYTVAGLMIGTALLIDACF